MRALALSMRELDLRRKFPVAATGLWFSLSLNGFFETNREGTEGLRSTRFFVDDEEEEFKEEQDELKEGFRCKNVFGLFKDESGFLLDDEKDDNPNRLFVSGFLLRPTCLTTFPLAEDRSARFFVLRSRACCVSVV